MLIDIGANAGLYSIFAALEERFADIVAYEPNQLCYDRMRANLLLNGLTDKVTTRRAAVSDHKGEVPFVYSPNNNDLFSQVVAEGSSRDTVPSVRLDDEWPITGRRVAIKMDIEGHERTALEGMKALLRNNDCFLQVECWEQNAEPFIAAMQAEGYRLIHTNRTKIVISRNCRRVESPSGNAAALRSRERLSKVAPRSSQGARLASGLDGNPPEGCTEPPAPGSTYPPPRHDRVRWATRQARPPS